MSEPVSAAPAEPKTEASRGHNYPFVYRLRFLLIVLLIFSLYPLPSFAYSDTIQTMTSFVPVALYMVSGYLLLRESESRSERILRTVKRTAVVFVCLCAGYILVNVVYSRILGSPMIETALSKRTWFNFLALNIWPLQIGKVIWYVQAMLYACVILYFLDKWKLLKYDWIIFLILYVLTVLTGELSGVIRFQIHGYTSLLGNFFTRALPYLLLGGILHRYAERLSRRVRKPVFVISLILSVFLMVLEVMVLDTAGLTGSYGHLAMAPVASVSLFMLFYRRGDRLSDNERIFIPTRRANAWIYYLLQPMIALLLIIGVWCQFNMTTYSSYVPFVAWFLCYLIALVITHRERKKEKHHHSHHGGHHTHHHEAHEAH